MKRILLFLSVCLLQPMELSADDEELTYGWDGEAEATVTLGDDYLPNLLSNTGNLGGVLSETHGSASGSLSANAAYTLTGNGYTLGASATLSASGQMVVGADLVGSTASISASTAWRDMLTLTGSGSGTIPFYSLNANWHLEGTFSGSLHVPEVFHTLNLYGRVDFDDPNTGDTIASFEYEQTMRSWGDNPFVLETSGSPTVSGLLSYSILLDDDARGSLKGGMRIEGSSNSGTLDISFGHTAQLVSLTFPDGSTPESHGLSIIFDSGLPSPNVVPEPSSGFLLIAGLLALLAAPARRIWRRPPRT